MTVLHSPYEAELKNVVEFLDSHEYFSLFKFVVASVAKLLFISPGLSPKDGATIYSM